MDSWFPLKTGARHNSLKLNLVDPSSFLLLKLNLGISLAALFFSQTHNLSSNKFCFLTKRTKKSLQLLKNFTSTALIQITAMSPELLYQPPKWAIYLCFKFIFYLFLIFIYSFIGYTGFLLLLEGFLYLQEWGVWTLLRCVDFSSWWLFLLRSTGSRWAQCLWHTGLAAQRHVEPSRTRDWTCLPCNGRQILNH